jgi:hypothetical protein
MRQYVPEEELWTGFGGKLDFEYDHETYWPALRKLCEEKGAFRKQRWVDGGSHIGEHEDYLAGGKEIGVAGTVSENDEKKDKQVTPTPEPVAEGAPGVGGTEDVNDAVTQVPEGAPSAGGAEDVTDALAKVELEGKPEDNSEADTAKPEKGADKVEGL